MQLVDPSNEALWTPAPPVEDVRDFTRMAEKLEAYRAEIGAACLAANQVGASVQLFVTKYPNFACCFNPTYTPSGDARTSKPEGSLNRKGWSAYVPRHDRVHCEWMDAKGEYCQADLKDMEARVFQFCTDACDGKPSFERPALKTIPQP